MQLSDLKKRVFKTFFDNVLLLGKNSKRFSSGNESESGRAPIVVLSRDSYFETEKEYRINNLKEVKKAVENEKDFLSPYKDTLCIFFLRKVAQGYRAQIFLIDNNFVQAQGLNSWAFLLVPESLLGYLNANLTHAVIQGDGHQVFIRKQADGSFSSHWDKVKLFAKDGDGAINHEISELDYSTYLKKGVPLLLNRHVFGLTPFLGNIASTFLKQANWKGIKVPAVIILGILAFESAYLVGMQYGINNYREGNLAPQREYLKLQQDFSSSVDRLNKIVELVNSTSPVSTRVKEVTDGLTSIKPLAIKFLNMENDEMRVRARANSATEVLTVLNQIDSVAEASLVDGVRAADSKDGQQEFHIRVVFVK